MESLKPVLLVHRVAHGFCAGRKAWAMLSATFLSRRGKVLGSDSQGGSTEIKAHVPMSEVLRYAPDLRFTTGGQGFLPWNLPITKKPPSLGGRKGRGRTSENKAAE